MHDVDMEGEDEYVVPRLNGLKRASPSEVEHQLKRLKIQRAPSPEMHPPEMPTASHLQMVCPPSPDRFDTNTIDVNYVATNRLLRQLHLLREMRRHHAN